MGVENTLNALTFATTDIWRFRWTLMIGRNLSLSIPYSTTPPILAGAAVRDAGDAGQGMAVDADGNAYVTGFTSSPNFPVKDARFNEG